MVLAGLSDADGRPPRDAAVGGLLGFSVWTPHGGPFGLRRRVTVCTGIRDGIEQLWKVLSQRTAVLQSRAASHQRGRGPAWAMALHRWDVTTRHSSELAADPAAGRGWGFPGLPGLWLARATTRLWALRLCACGEAGLEASGCGRCADASGRYGQIRLKVSTALRRPATYTNDAKAGRGCWRTPALGRIPTV